MNKSESIASLAKALSAAQSQMGSAAKDKENPYFKSHYADLSSVINAIREPLSSNGLSYVQVMEPSQTNEVRVETVLMHESGEWVSSMTAIPVSKVDAQGYGSAITYAKRYGLQGMVGLPSEDDDGNAAAKGKPNAQHISPTHNDNPRQNAYDQLDEMQQAAMFDIMREAISIYREVGDLDSVIDFLKAKDLSTEEKAAIPYYLQGEKTEDGKKLATAYSNLTKQRKGK